MAHMNENEKQTRSDVGQEGRESGNGCIEGAQFITGEASCLDQVGPSQTNAAGWKIDVMASKVSNAYESMMSAQDGSTIISVKTANQRASQYILWTIAKALECDEIWKAFPEAPRYEVSTFGRIRNTETRRVLRPTRKIYLMIGLSMDNRRNRTVHSMVAKTFIGPRPPGLYINHKDGNKLNNRVDNLEYVTAQENDRHAMKLGLKAKGLRNGAYTKPHRVRRGEDHGQAKLTSHDVLAILRSLSDAKDTHEAIAARFGVDRTLIGKIKAREIWTHLSVE